MTFSFNRMGNLGHLGNQMFQYAVLLGLSKKHNRNIVIPPKSSFGAHYNQRLKSNLYDAFDIKCDTGITDFPTIEAAHFHFDTEFFDNPPETDSNLFGFFQSEKYFINVEKEVRDAFTFRPEHLDLATIMRNQLSGKVASIHVRRTDYIGHTGHEAFGIEYYQKALKLIPDDVQCIVFTDDVNWVKTNPTFPDDRFLVSETQNPYIDMALMGLCNYHIIANSTFSWWGAWLSTTTEKVIAPSPWFGPAKNHDTSDVYCKNWIIVK